MVLTFPEPEVHGRLTRLNTRVINLRTPWLHIANPAVASRSGVDYGMMRNVAPIRVDYSIIDIVQGDIDSDAGFHKGIRDDLDRVLRQNDIEYVRNSHSAYVRQAFGQQLRGLTDRGWNGMGKHLEAVQLRRARAPVEHFKREIEGSKAWKKAAPVLVPVGGAAIAAYALYTKQPLNWDLSGGYSLGTQHNYDALMGSFSVGTPWFSAAVNYSVNAPDTRDPSLPAPENAVEASEKVSISLGHTVPVIGIATRLSYATTTGTISAAMSRGLLIPNLSGSIGTTRSLRPTRAGNYGEETVNLQYGMNF